jgi:hypothetical protein
LDKNVVPAALQPPPQPEQPPLRSTRSGVSFLAALSPPLAAAGAAALTEKQSKAVAAKKKAKKATDAKKKSGSGAHKKAKAQAAYKAAAKAELAVAAAQRAAAESEAAEASEVKEESEDDDEDEEDVDEETEAEPASKKRKTAGTTDAGADFDPIDFDSLDQVISPSLVVCKLFNTAATFRSLPSTSPLTSSERTMQGACRLTPAPALKVGASVICRTSALPRNTPALTASLLLSGNIALFVVQSVPDIGDPVVTLKAYLRKDHEDLLAEGLTIGDDVRLPPATHYLVVGELVRKRFGLSPAPAARDGAAGSSTPSLYAPRSLQVRL